MSINYSVLVFGSLFTCFASIVLAYISMATMIGPWIAPTVVLMASLFLKLRSRKRSHNEVSQELTLIQTMASVGGLVAIGIGFTLPTLYFLDQAQFMTLLSQPLSFIGLIAATTIAAGGLGNWLGRMFAHRLIVQENLPFPVSSLIYTTINSQAQESQARSMMTGFGLTTVVCMLRDGVTLGRFFSLPALLPWREIQLFHPEFMLSFSPMIWAIGFTTGFSIALPLLVGMISKYLVIYPLNYHAHYLPIALFQPFKEENFVMAFCSGLVIIELMSGLFASPRKILAWLRKSFSINLSSLLEESSVDHGHDQQQTASSHWQWWCKIEPFVMIALLGGWLGYFAFPYASYLFFMSVIAIVTYQTNYLGGKIGLVQFGRFVTFVMIPALLFFKLNAVQITMLCVFVSIVLATSSNLLFEYKVGDLCSLSRRKIYSYQWLGLIVSAVALGVAFWLLFNHLTIGSAELFAQRGKSRALLVQSLNFDPYVVALGMLYGLALKPFKMSPTMVFGGILMPNSLTIGLVLGAAGSLMSKKPQEQYPFWSGVFSAESVWLVANILLRMV